MKSKTKIGRNDPCPCGSGRKYKKCCLNRYRYARLDELIQKSVAPIKSISLRPITPADMRSIKIASQQLKKQQKI